MKCVLVGTGDMAHALARQYSIISRHQEDNNMLHDSASSFCVASPTREFVPDSYFHDTGIPFVNLAVGLQEAHVIILAIPGKAMAAFLEAHHGIIKPQDDNADQQDEDKLIFNINNDQSAQEETAAALDEYHLRWVQGLNDIGAIDLLGRSNHKKTKPQTRISGKDAYAVSQAKKFVETAFGFDVTTIEHSKRKYSEQDSLGKEWKHAAYIAMVLYIGFVIVISVHYYKRWPFPYKGYKWPVTTQNKIVSCTAVGLFALSVMPGTMARLIKAWQHNDSLYMLPETLLWALSIRKHVGLMGLFFLMVHAIMSVIKFSPGAYYWWAFDGVEAKEMNMTGEVSMMFAVYSTVFYIIIGISSLPSVGEAMNKAQWGFVFGPLCWTALAFGHVHYCMIYFRVIQGTLNLYGGIPHASLLGSLLPWLAFFLKFVQLCFTYGLPLIRCSSSTSSSSSSFGNKTTTTTAAAEANPRRSTVMRGYSQRLSCKDKDLTGALDISDNS